MEVLIPMSETTGAVSAFNNPTAVVSEYLIEACDIAGWRVPTMLGKVTGVKE